MPLDAAIAPGSGSEPGHDVLVQPQDVPVQPVRQGDGAVAEPMYLGEFEHAGPDPAVDDPAAGGTEIDRAQADCPISPSPAVAPLIAGRLRQRRSRPGCAARWSARGHRR